jgi:hypothetical protein
MPTIIQRAYEGSAYSLICRQHSLPNIASRWPAGQAIDEFKTNTAEFYFYIKDALADPEDEEETPTEIEASLAALSSSSRSSKRSSRPDQTTSPG